MKIDGLWAKKSFSQKTVGGGGGGGGGGKGDFSHKKGGVVKIGGVVLK